MRMERRSRGKKIGSWEEAFTSWQAEISTKSKCDGQDRLRRQEEGQTSAGVDRGGGVKLRARTGQLQ
eukprot:764884-Hanusia_phi.AAC.4